MISVMLDIHDLRMDLRGCKDSIEVFERATLATRRCMMLERRLQRAFGLDADVRWTADVTGVVERSIEAPPDILPQVTEEVEQFLAGLRPPRKLFNV